jgi:uncharacterized membrane protein YeaQ/YmgE (transglycosylase-associated protein family)
MLSLIGTIIIGFFVGLIARALHPGNDKLSFIWTVVLGVGGALLAKFVGQAVGWYQEGESAGFIFSSIGAVVLLLGYSFYQRSKSKP